MFNGKDIRKYIPPSGILGRPRSASIVDKDTIAGAPLVQADISAAIEFLELLRTGKAFHDLPYFSKCPAAMCPSSRQKPEKSWALVLESIRVLAEAEWFNRTWTIQEITLAQPATVIYGRDSFSWSLLVDAWLAWNAQIETHHSQCILTLPKEEYQLLRTFSGKVLDLFWARYSWETGQPLVEQLLRFRSKKVTVPKDKIYGLLGLQSGSHVVPVVPDFNASVEKVFKDFAVSLISSQDWIVPLHLDLTRGYYDLPSWVPCWVHWTNDSADYAVAQLRAVLTYKSAQGLKTKPIIHKDMSLELMGFEVDKVAKPSTLRCRLKEAVADQIVQIDSWRTFENLDQRRKRKYIGGGKIGDAHHRTLFADRFHDNIHCSPLQESHVDEWNRHLKDTRRKLREDQSRTTYGVTKAMRSYMYAAYRRRLFVTSRGYIGLCPEECQAGDRIFVLSHCPAPIFLRPQSLRPGDNKYIALGHGYIHGIMNGEAVKMGLPLQQVMII